jgi:hypothetical protein
MKIILISLAYIIFFYSIYKISFWFSRRKSKKDLYKMTEIYFLEHTFKIDVKKIGLDKMFNIVALSNAIIFTIVLMSTTAIDNLLLRFIVMFIMLLPIIYLVYYIIAKYLKKRGF